jgi:hypothetical protein
MAGERTLTVKILGDATGASKAFARLEKDSEGIGGKLASLGAAMGKVFLGAGVAASAFGVKAVLSASDLAETMSKVGIVFGDQQKIVTDFANQMAKDFGTPKREILDAASSIGLIGKASGLSQGDAAKMSTQLAQMAADASSFYNVPLPEALQAIQSGLVGEAEPMRRFGVLLNEQAVNAEAARLGLQKVDGAYTEGAKAQARASLIMSGMKDASGDLERTQGSLANRLKEVRGRAENFAADVGTKLLPVVLDAFDLFEKWGGILKAKLTPYLDDLRSIVGQVGDAMVVAFEWVKDNVLPVLESIGGFIKDNFVPILAGLGGAFGILLGAAAIGGVVTILGALAGVLASPIAIFVALVAGVVYAYQRFEAFRDVVDGVAKFLTGTVMPAIAKLADYLTEQLGNAVEWVQRMWPQISEAIGHVLRVVREVIGVFVDWVSAVWRAWGDDLLRIVQTAFEYIRGTIDNFLQVIRGIIQTVVALINGDWGKAWDGIKQIFAGVWDQIVNIVRTAIDVLKSIAGGIVSAFGEVLRPLGNFLHTWIVQPLEDVVGAVRAMPGKITAAASGMWDGIKNAFRSAINWIIRAWNGLEFKIPGFDPPGPGPSFGGFTLGVPNIPQLAHGGIVRARSGGTLALLGEGGRDEAVIPLPRGGGVTAAPSYHIDVHVAGSVVTELDLIRAVKEGLQADVRRNGSMGL